MDEYTKYLAVSPIEISPDTRGRYVFFITIKDQSGKFTTQVQFASTRKQAEILRDRILDIIRLHKNPSPHSVHTALFDRCVRDVKRKGGAYNPYAVCMSTLGEERAIKKSHRRKNPVNGFLLTVKNTATGQRAYYTGEEPQAFDSNRRRGKVYASAAHAQAAARMLARDKNLRPGWRYAVAVASRSNPESGENLYTDFHGEAPRRIKHHDLRQFSRGLEIGPVFAITYDTLRDGKNIRFEHEFSRRAAPLLIASDDGRTLALTGGRYQFTDRGIVDRK